MFGYAPRGSKRSPFGSPSILWVVRGAMGRAWYVIAFLFFNLHCWCQSFQTQFCSLLAPTGWLLRLDVPEQNRSGQILPCAPSFPVFNSNLAELCSAPGRQSAAFSRTSQLRCLASNLSAVATATSLAETNPSVSSGGVWIY